MRKSYFAKHNYHYLAVAWTIVVGIALCYVTLEQHQDAIDEAIAEARTFWALNVAYRSWNAQLGGVYADIDKVRPNPYLSAPGRDKKTTDGLRLTLVNPAYMSGMVAEIISKRSQPPVFLKLTSLKLLNPANKPDDWERKALRSFAQGRREAVEVTSLGKNPYLRLMLPFYIEESCLKCHGHQGYKVGEVRGGATVALPLQPHFDGQVKSEKITIAACGSFWLAGILGLVFFSRSQSAQEKKSRAALEKSERHYRDLIETTSDWVWAADENFKYTYVSPKIVEILGYSPEELLGRSPMEFMGIEEAHRIKAIVEPLVAQHLPFNEVEITNRHKDGRTVVLSTSGVPVLGPERELLGYHGIDRDITKRKQTEKTLLSQSQILDSLFQSALTPLVILDRDFNFIRVNEAYARSCQRRVEEFPGHNHFEFYPQADNEAIFRQVVATKEPFQVMAKPFIFADHPEWGETYWDWTLNPLLDDAGEVEYLVFSLKDVTNRIRARQKLAHAYEEVKNEAEVSGALLAMMEKLNTSLDEKDLIRNVTNLAPQYLKFDKVAIYLYYNESQSFGYAGGYGIGPATEGVLASRLIKGEAFPALERLLKADTVIIDNGVGQSPEDARLMDMVPSGSMVIVPISYRGKLIGAIRGGYGGLNKLEAKDIALFKGLADGMAIALQNSRLYKESIESLMKLSAKMETIRAMARLDRDILANIDRNTILMTATSLINQLIPCERTAVVLKEGDLCRVISEWGIGEFQNRTYAAKELHMETLEERRGPVFINDISQDETDCHYHRELAAIGIQSSFLLPLICRGQIIGLLDIDSMHFGRLTPEHLDTAGNIASQITVALENARLYEDLRQLLIATIASLTSAIDAKSTWTKGHSERVTKYATEIGKEMGLGEEQLDRLKLAGLLHDIGKIGTIDLLLDKSGKLTDEEFALVKQHPRKGQEILLPIKQLHDVIPAVLHHHEQYAGGGYPDGIKGEEIPLMARILSVADAYDAMTADRPYRQAPGKEYAMAEFKAGSGKQFDPQVAEAFLSVMER